MDPDSHRGGLVVLLLVLTGLIGVPYVEQGVAQTAGLFHTRFWKAPFYASAAWTFGDSGATNVTALGTAVAAILASSAVLTSIFPGIDLNPFIIMNVACGGIVAATPLLFAIANVAVMRKNPVIPADARLALQPDTTITLPSGASIAVPGGATVRKAGGGPEKARVKAGGTIPIPPGSVLTVKSEAIVALPSGAVVAIGPGANLTTDTGAQIASGDLAPPQVSQSGGLQRICNRHAGASAPDPQIAAGDLITVTQGATATVTGTADIFHPHYTTIVTPRRGMGLRANTTLTVPPGPNVMTAAMGSVLPAAAPTMFGTGTEIGLVAVLAAHYSAAGQAGRVAAVVISAVVAAGLILYGATGIRSLADPSPGTSLSSGGGTSFTL